MVRVTGHLKTAVAVAVGSLAAAIVGVFAVAAALLVSVLAVAAVVVLLLAAGPAYALKRLLRPKPVADLGVLLAMPAIRDEERNTTPRGGPR